ncbi:hypothetical protein [Polyangium jinanense]|uniref:Uncharacterized protein n=1 Tax=Polyangium jinanense TaxID=2829994 RepID=A0A9X3XHX5_9BACT|nr:hypothetical protein [Polyangium jinanense]MDC3962272.1 hypothetical protein [Polyangium jinanense]MDC3962555.1 hypothetical protein [Polyangium jinanense]MDC3989413.1 hypothetical protein [Polyangium jinanense]
MLQVLDADEEYLVATRGHVLVTVWGRINLDRVRRAFAVKRWLLEESDHDAKSFGLVAVIIPQRLAIPDSLEAEMRKLDEFMAPHVLASAVVVEGDGMRSSLLRGTVKATSALKVRAYPEKNFGDIGDAVRWLVPQIATKTRQVISAEDLAWDIAEARALHHHIG